ncbi:MAG: hypothetical protein ACLFVI_02700, partial [Archaeoglobaceae archaeon]
ITVIFIAVLAIHVLVLPSTVTLFAGQHVWYQKEAIPCQKCHADVAEEFKSPLNHHPGPGESYAIWEACVFCHQVEPLYPGDVNQGEGYHAAALVPCDYCHWEEANAFENDPHKPFVESAENEDLMTNGTEACVACHTHVQVEINFTWRTHMTFGYTANADADRSDPWTAGEGLWNATEDFGAEGSESHYIVNRTAYIDKNRTELYKDNLR